MHDPQLEGERQLESRWIQQCQMGDPEAFDALIEKYMPRLYSVIFHLVGNHEDTSDLMMESFEKAYRSIMSFKSDSSFFTWLYRIAVNRTLNFLRRNRRKHLADLSLDAEDPYDEKKGELMDPHVEADVERQLHNRELAKKLNESLQSLSEDHRAVVTLFDIDGLSHAEIAQIMGCSEGTVRSRLFYAHKQLQKQLQDYL